MFRFYSKALLLVCVPLLPSVADAKQPRQPAITVRAAETSVHAWTTRVSHALDQSMVYPRAPGRSPYAEGVARVSFRCSESGQPERITLAQSSKNPELDRAALAAVRDIGTLHPLPDGVTHDRPMEAWLIFADDEQRVASLKRATQRKQEIALRASATGDKVAALAPLVIASR